MLGFRLRFKYSSLLKLKGFYMLFYSTLWAINYCNEMYMSIMIQRIISMSSRSITAHGHSMVEGEMVMKILKM